MVKVLSAQKETRNLEAYLYDVILEIDNQELLVLVSYKD